MTFFQEKHKFKFCAKIVLQKLPIVGKSIPYFFVQKSIHCVIFEGTVQKKLSLKKCQEFFILTIRQVQNARKTQISMTEFFAKYHQRVMAKLKMCQIKKQTPLI